MCLIGTAVRPDDVRIGTTGRRPRRWRERFDGQGTDGGVDGQSAEAAGLAPVVVTDGAAAAGSAVSRGSTQAIAKIASAFREPTRIR